MERSDIACQHWQSRRDEGGAESNFHQKDTDGRKRKAHAEARRRRGGKRENRWGRTAGVPDIFSGEHTRPRVWGPATRRPLFRRTQLAGDSRRDACSTLQVGRPLRFATVSVDLHAPACRALRAACGSLPSGCPRRLGVLPAPNARLDPFTKRCRAGFGEASLPSRVGSTVFLPPPFSMDGDRMP
jgi:hypothetical protein